MNEVKSNKQYHPQMHSAEHILNQTMVRMFDCGRSFSNHIEKKKSKCDYYFSRDLTETELEEIERQVNEIIQNDLMVFEEFISKDDAEKKFNLTKVVAKIATVILEELALPIPATYAFKDMTIVQQYCHFSSKNASIIAASHVTRKPTRL